jgi:hypothetical protein
MEWVPVLGLFLANAGLIVWFRTESRNDWKHMDSKLDLYMAESRVKLDAYMKESQEERREFHGRLCSIEERNKGK